MDLGKWRQELSELEAECFTADECASMVAEFAKLEKACQAARARFAARAEAGYAYRKLGYTDAARHAIVIGMHTSVFVGAGIMLVAVAGVLRWLPARAPAPGVRAPVPACLGPVDVTPAAPASDIAIAD